MMKYSKFLGIATAVILVFSSPAWSANEEGILLTQSDFDYLHTLGMERNNTVLQKMSPKELYRLHRLIIEERTKADPKAKAEAVWRLLTEFDGNQQWDKDNPGQFWDAKKTQIPAAPSGK